MNQQRSRRFRSARDAAEARQAALRRGEPTPAGEPFDSNCITPGTAFMARLSEHLQFFIRKQQTHDPAWQRMTVLLSGHEARASPPSLHFLCSEPSLPPAGPRRGRGANNSQARVCAVR